MADVTSAKNQKETPVKPEKLGLEKQELSKLEQVKETSEQTKEVKETIADERITAQSGEIPAAEVVSAVPASAVKPIAAVDPFVEKIESVLEEDLQDLYKSMPVQTQQIFKKKGEETLSKIRILVNKTKVNAKKIFQLIRAWLKIIPGVNKFFLEQEAKIKTDKILLMQKEEKQRNSGENEIL